MKNEINAVLENMTTTILPENRPRGTGSRRKAAQTP